MRYATDQESLERDTEIEFFRGSGPGGQNRNKVESGVRLRHIPSGIVVEAEDARSQGQNKKHAFERLKMRLEELNQPPKLRIPTKVPRAAKRARLQEKRVHSTRKQERQQPPIE
ncbi:MAG TPA: peptide chain release factor-like protein [Candidatus Paceibacterota bacterium]